MAMSYPKKLFIAIDQLLNALKGGYPDETLSSAAWRSHRDGKGSFIHNLYNIIVFWDKDENGNLNHCYDSYISELYDKHLPPEFRDSEIKNDYIFKKDFKVRHVSDITKGIGTVIMVQTTGLFPVIVQWEDDSFIAYTKDGMFTANMITPSIRIYKEWAMGL